MKIKFKTDIELEVVESYDEANDHAETSNETFKAGEVHEVDLLDSAGDMSVVVDIQFGDGSVAFSVPTDFFEVLP